MHKRGIENYYWQQYALHNLMCVCKDNWHIKYPCQELPFLRSVQENRSQTLLKEASFSFGEFQWCLLLQQCFYLNILLHEQQYLFILGNLTFKMELGEFTKKIKLHVCLQQRD